MQPLRLPLNCLPQHDTHSLSLIRRLDISSLDLVSRSKSVTAGVKSPHVTKEPADSFGTSERGDELAASIFAEHESEDNKQCIASHRSPPQIGHFSSFKQTTPMRISPSRGGNYCIRVSRNKERNSLLLGYVKTQLGYHT